MVPMIYDTEAEAEAEELNRDVSLRAKSLCGRRYTRRSRRTVARTERDDEAHSFRASGSRRHRPRSFTIGHQIGTGVNNNNGTVLDIL